MHKIAERLNETLKRKGVTQTALAKSIHVTQQSINCFCLGKAEPSSTTLFMIASALGESSDYLLGLSDIPK